MKHEILYQPSYAVVKVQLERGEAVMAESGAMVSMSPTIKIEAAVSGGGLFSALKSAAGGESMFRTTFTAERGPGEILLAPASTGDIMAIDLADRKVFCQPGAYLAGSKELKIETRGSLKGFLSGEGLFLLEVSGRGTLFVNSFGAIHEVILAPGEEYIVDTGNIVCFDSSVSYGIEKATGKSEGLGGFLKGALTSALSGEGFVCRYRGPGRICLQTRCLHGFAKSLLPFFPSKG